MYELWGQVGRDLQRVPRVGIRSCCTQNRGIVAQPFVATKEGESLPRRRWTRRSGLADCEGGAHARPRRRRAARCSGVCRSACAGFSARPAHECRETVRTKEHHSRGDQRLITAIQFVGRSRRAVEKRGPADLWSRGRGTGCLTKGGCRGRDCTRRDRGARGRR